VLGRLLLARRVSRRVRTVVVAVCLSRLPLQTIRVNKCHLKA
jgi:hypothetical protein